MEISCDCGSFKAKLTSFPKDSPGRLMCYCDDCQDYLQRLGRTDLLDDFGGTEVVPVYPGDIQFLQGQEHLQCNRLSERGIDRWSVTCCNTPMVNTLKGRAWAGVFHQAYTRQDADALNRIGSVRARIFGMHAREGAPFKIAKKIGFKEMLAVLPFVIKGRFAKKHLNSPFFKADGVTLIREPRVLAKG